MHSALPTTLHICFKALKPRYRRHCLVMTVICHSLQNHRNSKNDDSILLALMQTSAASPSSIHPHSIAKSTLRCSMVNTVWRMMVRKRFATFFSASLMFAVRALSFRKPRTVARRSRLTCEDNVTPSHVSGCLLLHWPPDAVL